MSTKNIFEGYSETFIPLEDGYDSEQININHVTNQLNETAFLLSRGWAVMVESRCWGSAILPSIVASRIALQKTLTVLDFGGGAGKQCAEIIRAIPEDLVARFQYHLVETPAFCALSQHYLKTFFHQLWETQFWLTSDIPTTLKTDIVSCTSSLQYLEDYQEAITKLLSTEPSVFLMTNTPINDQKTYSRIQNNLATKVAQWVFGITDLDTLFKAHGYRRTYWARHELAYPTEGTPTGTETHFCSVIYTKHAI